MGVDSGTGLQKFGYLPEDTTDFLFAVICEEMGFIGRAGGDQRRYAAIRLGGDSILRRRETSATLLRLIVIGSGGDVLDPSGD